MTVSLLPNIRPQFFDSSGTPGTGYQVFFYTAGTANKENTYSDSAGTTANPNPIILDSGGFFDNSGTEIDVWLSNGVTYDIVIAPSTDSDPPVAALRTIENVTGNGTADEWGSSYTATRSDADTFTIAGTDVTSVFTEGRAVKLTGGADRYAVITSSSFSTDTTVNVEKIVDSAGASSTLHASMDTAYAHIIGFQSTIGDGYIQVKNSDSNAIANTLDDWIGFQTVRVNDFGDNATPGTTDMTTAIQNAINSFGSGNGRVEFAAETYLVTSTITVAQDRIHLVGQGMHATKIKFEPTANDTCFSFTKGASVLYQGSLRDMAFYSADKTYVKTAIDISDTSGFLVENISISGDTAGGLAIWSDGTNASIGINTKGREFGLFNYLYLTANKPIVMSSNPNSTIDVDHYNFTNLYLTGDTNNPLITVDTGINLTNAIFDGAQAWVGGTYGFYWSDTTTSQTSNTLTFKNIRTEQGTGATNYSIYLSHNYGIYNVSIKNCYFDIARYALYFRNTDNLTFDNVHYDGTGEALNVDSTVDLIEIRNCFWQASSTTTMTGQRQIWGIPKFPSSGALSSNAIYEDNTTTQTRNMVLGGALGQETITLAAAGTQGLGANTMAGILIVTDSTYNSAIFHLDGTGTTVTELHDTNTAFSTTASTASSTNIYWSAGNSQYEIENNTGAQASYRINLLGTYTGGF